MKAGLWKVWILVLVCVLVSGCSVVSKNLREQAVPADTDFETIQQNAQQYKGQTVILGGYILKTRNLADRTEIAVLQAPLGHRDQPEARDKSKGRFMVVDNGFLDPAIYKKGRMITVAGEVMGRQTVKIQEFTYDMLKLRTREIYLWQEQQEDSRWNYYDPYYPWPDPYYRYRYGPYHPFYW